MLWKDFGATNAAPYIDFKEGYAYFSKTKHTVLLPNIGTAWLCGKIFQVLNWPTSSPAIHWNNLKYHYIHCDETGKEDRYNGKIGYVCIRDQQHGPHKADSATLACVVSTHWCWANPPLFGMCEYQGGNIAQSSGIHDIKIFTCLFSWMTGKSFVSMKSIGTVRKAFPWPFIDLWPLQGKLPKVFYSLHSVPSIIFVSITINVLFNE